jgi:hypothetical protein
MQAKPEEIEAVLKELGDQRKYKLDNKEVKEAVCGLLDTLFEGGGKEAMYIGLLVRGLKGFNYPRGL